MNYYQIYKYEKYVKICLLILFFSIIFYNFYFNLNTHLNLINKQFLTLKNYQEHTIIKRKDLNYSLVDSNIHFQGYGNNNIPYETLVNWLIKSNILFCTITGLGQSLPFKSKCQYYLECKNEQVKDTIVKDMLIGTDYNKYFEKYKDKILIIFAASFVDLKKPNNIMEQIHLLNDNFYNEIKSIGETNVCKPILRFNNYHCIKTDVIPYWKNFMNYLEKNNIPVLLHCDLGDKENPTKYLHLMDKICKTYPNNKIIWPHMGISYESKYIDVKEHLEIMTYFLNKYPNLYFDLTWDVLYNVLFKNNKEKCIIYGQFFNKYYNRFLPGTDFVASGDKTFDDFITDLKETSYIYQFVDNRAFRFIALGQNYIDLYKLNYTAPIVVD